MKEGGRGARAEPPCEGKGGYVQTGSKVAVFTESVIRETFRLAIEHGAINLRQGLRDFPCPPELS